MKKYKLEPYIKKKYDLWIYAIVLAAFVVLSSYFVFFPEYKNARERKKMKKIFLDES